MGNLTTVLGRFGLGVGILLLSTLTFVRSGKDLSRALKISPLVIGLTVIALGTSLPELAVSTVGSVQRDVGLALGNLIGSNIVNVILVFPVGILVGGLRVGTTKTQRSAFLMLAASALFLFAQFSGVSSTIFGFFFIALALAFSLEEYFWGVEGRQHEDLRRFKSQGKKKVTAFMVGTTALSLGGVIAGATLAVSSVESLSLLTGYSTSILGLSLAAVATSLPELFTSIFSQEAGEEKMTVGNLLGSNIYNLMFIGGIVTLISGTNKVAGIGNMVALLAASCLFFWVIQKYKGKVIPRRVGVLLLLLFVVYLYLLSAYRSWWS